VKTNNFIELNFNLALLVKIYPTKGKGILRENRRLPLKELVMEVVE